MNQFPFEAAEEVCCKDSPCGPCSGRFSGWPVTEGRAVYWTSLSLWKISPGFERSRCTAIASAARIPRCFFALPQPKGKALWRTSRKIREDLYALDGLLQYDWRDGFASSTAVLSSKWAPVIDYLKTLATEIL